MQSYGLGANTIMSQADSAAPKHHGDIMNANVRLDSQILRLDELTRQMEKRLSPVMRGADPVSGGTEGKDAPFTGSPMAGTMYSKADSIRRLGDFVSGMLDRLDLE